MAQHESIGIPSEGELQSSPNAVWVEYYTRDDGTEVKGYWRSKPESGEVTDKETNNRVTQPNEDNITSRASRMQTDSKNSSVGIIIDKDSIDKIPSPTDESQGIAGVMKGKQMSVDEAGGKNVNPNYDGGDIKYSKNCQACIGVFEARLRGYNIEALPYDKKLMNFWNITPNTYL